MFELIDKVLVDCGDMDVVVMGCNVFEEIGCVFKEFFGDVKVIIIVDENIWVVVGEQIKVFFEGVGVEIVELMIFLGCLVVYVCYVNVEKICDYMCDFDGVIVCLIGLGIFNDIIK